MDRIDVLLVGSGGREHALAWKLAQSGHLGRLYAAPGNPGIATVAECVPVPVSDLTGLVALAQERKVHLAVIGPEAPLAAGLADRLIAAGIPTFGPTAAAARIESSKAYARELMLREGVPQPAFARFSDLPAAEAYLQGLESQGAVGAVVKADGLAAGKGAVVCDSMDEAVENARAMLQQGSMGRAGEQIVIEERLTGEEVSLFILADGERAVPLIPAQDYKRALDGDRGLNTGGMGAYAPAPVLDAAGVDEAMARIVLPTLGGLAADGAPFRGCLYAGLIKTPSGLQVIEFNCRFGDPETQVVLPLLESDLLELMWAVARGKLEDAALSWTGGCAVNVVLASGGYPGPYASGVPIEGLKAAGDVPDALLFHAGTARRGEELVTAGGRVLSVTGLGESFARARESAYAAARAVRFDPIHYRSDIALRVVEPEGE